MPLLILCSFSDQQQGAQDPPRALPLPFWASMVGGFKHLVLFFPEYSQAEPPIRADSGFREHGQGLVPINYQQLILEAV